MAADTQSSFRPMHHSEVVGYLRDCSDVFGRLAALLSAIQDKAGEDSEIGKLAALGMDVAGDMDNYADAAREHAQKGGVVA